MASWDNIANGQRIEIGLVQIDIAGSSRIDGPAESVKLLKDILERETTSIYDRNPSRIHGADGQSSFARVARFGSPKRWSISEIRSLQRA